MSNQILIAAIPQHAAIENSIRVSTDPGGLNQRGTTGNYLTIPLSANGLEPASHKACDWRTSEDQRSELKGPAFDGLITAGKLVIYDNMSLHAALAIEGLQIVFRRARP